MNINEWTQKTDIEHEERLELEDNLHLLFKQILEEHLPIKEEKEWV